MSAVEIRPVAGVSVEPWLDDLAVLRMEVLRDYPHLYDSDLDTEREYLARYTRSDQSLFVLALENNLLVGAATAMPLKDAESHFQWPFRQLGNDLPTVFYFGESLLLPAYRGQGIGHRFLTCAKSMPTSWVIGTPCFAVWSATPCIRCVRNMINR